MRLLPNNYSHLEIIPYDSTVLHGNVSINDNNISRERKLKKDADTSSRQNREIVL